MKAQPTTPPRIGAAHYRALVLTAGRVGLRWGSSPASSSSASTCADRTRWDVTAEQWNAFQAALDAPPRDLPRLRELLARPAPWEQ